MKDGRTLEDCHVHESSLMHIIYRPRGAMHISIELLTGETFQMRLYANDTVGDLKARIQDEEFIPSGE